MIERQRKIEKTTFSNNAPSQFAVGKFKDFNVVTNSCHKL